MVKQGEAIKALGHDTELVGKKDATCEADGYTGDEVCKVCAKVVKAGEVIKALGHDTELVGKKETTCEADGYTGDEVCKVCAKVVKAGEVIKALGHNTELVGKIEATCETDGYTGDEVCKVCDKVVKAGEVIKALGHSTELVGKIDATCKEAGYTGDEVCKVCGKVVTNGQVIPATGHNYVGIECQNCGDKLVVVDKVEDIDTTKPVEEVTPVIKQEAVDTTATDIMNVVDAILSGSITEDIKNVISEVTMNAIKQEVESGKQIATEIIADVVDENDLDAADVEKIKEQLGESGVVAQFLDLAVLVKSVAADGAEKELGTLNALSEKITFTIMVPEELIKDGREFYVIRVHDGKAETLATTKNADGTYSFETDRFSSYALAYEDVENVVGTGDAANITMYVMLLAVAVCAFGIAKKKGVVVK